CTIVNVRTNTGNKAKAQMIGLKYITGDLMAFTDADTILDKTFLENSLACALHIWNKNSVHIPDFIMLNFL
ncbi:MAG: glycosyltransferase, partial [Candidatus Bathyarchaeota archaeon]